MADLFVVSEGCPVGCGIEVILLRARLSGRLFAYCDLCGCVWADPAAARFERGPDEIVPPWVLAPEGVEFPQVGDVNGAGLAGSVVRTMPVSDQWMRDVEELNGKIRREGAT